MWGEGSGGWVGLNLCRLLAEQGGGALVKVFVSDGGALDNDFVEVRHYMTQPLVELYGGCMVVLKVS